MLLAPDEILGGLYGESLGAAFFGESMFARAPDASKAAKAARRRRLGPGLALRREDDAYEFLVADARTGGTTGAVRPGAITSPFSTTTICACRAHSINSCPPSP